MAGTSSFAPEALGIRKFKKQEQESHSKGLMRIDSAKFSSIKLVITEKTHSSREILKKCDVYSVKNKQSHTVEPSNPALGHSKSGIVFEIAGESKKEIYRNWLWFVNSYRYDD